MPSLTILISLESSTSVSLEFLYNLTNTLVAELPVVSVYVKGVFCLLLSVPVLGVNVKNPKSFSKVVPSIFWADSVIGLNNEALLLTIVVAPVIL